MATYEGRLELTWTNKRLRLLAHDDGAYEWVEPADFRVAEVRLLHDAGSVGAAAPAAGRAGDNLLIRGDALNALTSLIELPEFAPAYLGQVKLAYLVPSAEEVVPHTPSTTVRKFVRAFPWRSGRISA